MGLTESRRLLHTCALMHTPQTGRARTRSSPVRQHAEEFIMKANRQGSRNLISAVAIAGCVLQISSFRVQAESVQQGSTTELSRSVFDAPRSVVNYGDLDLSRPEGINTLEIRIRRAVDSVCELSGGKGLSRARMERDCRDLALANAMAQVQALSASANVARHSEHK
jgi:UrcA family protein